MMAKSPEYIQTVLLPLNLKSVNLLYFTQKSTNEFYIQSSVIRAILYESFPSKKELFKKLSVFNSKFGPVVKNEEDTLHRGK